VNPALERDAGNSVLVTLIEGGGSAGPGMRTCPVELSATDPWKKGSGKKKRFSQGSSSLSKNSRSGKRGWNHCLGGAAISYNERYKMLLGERKTVEKGGIRLEKKKSKLGMGPKERHLNRGHRLTRVKEKGSEDAFSPGG